MTVVIAIALAALRPVVHSRVPDLALQRKKFHFNFRFSYQSQLDYPWGTPPGSNLPGIQAPELAQPTCGLKARTILLNGVGWSQNVKACCQLYPAIA